MANSGNQTEYSAEKESPTNPPSPTHEDSKPQELLDTVLDENNKNEVRVLDDTGIKSTPPREHVLATPSDWNGNSAELPAEPPVEQPGPPGKDYSILTIAQKRIIVLTASFASLFSPMATAIYCEHSIDFILRRASS